MKTTLRVFFSWIIFAGECEIFPIMLQNVKSLESCHREPITLSKSEKILIPIQEKS